ncbi:MAG: hypothetical protein DI524_15485 [Ectopseudomonas oleovorans]|nr:MAG: hypothetical protein DI524_15485 [Pseudomonas oleovorans]
MYLVQLTQYMAGQWVAVLADQADPAGQAQHHQYAPGGLVASTLAQRDRGEVAAQLSKIRQRTEAVSGTQHPKHLPAIAFKGRQAGVEHQGGRSAK